MRSRFLFLRVEWRALRFCEITILCGEAYETTEKGWRDFLKSLALGAAGAAMLTPQTANAAEGGTLQVWSCGGLAEAMMPAHEA